MNTLTWLEHFKDRIAGITEEFEKNSSGESLLQYALNKKLLSSAELCHWASSTYGLPVLNSKFFTDTPFSQEFFAKWATHYSWSMECLPVAEWDGNLIIACLIPPQDLALPSGVISVLASYENLSDRWNVMLGKAAPEKTTAARIPNSSEMPEGFAVNSNQKQTSAPKDTFSFDDLANDIANDLENSENDLSSSNEGSEEHTSDDIRLDDGGDLNLNIPDERQTPSSQTSSIDFSSLHKKTAEPVIEKKEAVAQEEIAAFTSPAVDSPAKTAIIPLSAEIKAKINLPPLPVDSDDDLILQEMPTSVDIKIKPEIKVLPKSQDVKKDVQKDVSKDVQKEEKLDNVTPLSPRNSDDAALNFNPSISTSFYLERYKKKNKNAIKEQVKLALHGMKEQFEKCMILSLDESETQIVAFAWDDKFGEIKDPSLKIQLKTPSIFNIVTSTQKPFHGYVSLNEINEKFFEVWNSGNIPDHVTLTPIIVEDRVTGIVLGMAEKKAYNKNALALAEKISTDFSSRLEAA